MPIIPTLRVLQLLKASMTSAVASIATSLYQVKRLNEHQPLPDKVLIGIKMRMSFK